MFTDHDREWLRRKIRHIERAFRALEHREIRIMAVIDDLTTKLAGISTKADGIQASVTAVRGDIADIKNGLPTAGGLTAAEVATLSTALDALGTKVDAVATDAAELDSENPAPTPAP